MMPTRTSSPPNSLPQTPLRGRGMLWSGWQGTVTPSPLAEPPKQQEPGGAAGAEPWAGSCTRRAGTAGIPAEGQRVAAHGSPTGREGSLGGSATAEGSDFPRPKVTSPRCRDASHPETHPGVRLTWGGPSGRSRPSPSIARGGLTSCGSGEGESSGGRGASSRSRPGATRGALSPPPPAPSRVSVSRATSGLAEATGTAWPVCGGSGSMGSGRGAHAVAARAARTCGNRHGHPEGIRAAAAADTARRGRRRLRHPCAGGGSIPSWIRRLGGRAAAVPPLLSPHPTKAGRGAVPGRPPPSAPPPPAPPPAPCPPPAEARAARRPPERGAASRPAKPRNPRRPRRRLIDIQAAWHPGGAAPRPRPPIAAALPVSMAMVRERCRLPSDGEAGGGGTGPGGAPPAARVPGHCSLALGLRCRCPAPGERYSAGARYLSQPLPLWGPPMLPHGARRRLGLLPKTQKGLCVPHAGAAVGEGWRMM